MNHFKRSIPMIVLLIFLVVIVTIYRERFTILLPKNTMQLSSPAFKSGGRIPTIYTCEGKNINPPFSIINVPKNTKSLTLIMDDPDIPQFAKDKYHIEEWDHWTVFNISPSTSTILEGKNPEGTLGINSGGVSAYTGPCPPDREHRYFFRLYALDTSLTLKSGATKKEVLQAMEGHILEISELMGLYEKQLK